MNFVTSKVGDTFFTKKKILLTLFLLSTFCYRSSALSADPHPRDPNLGEFGIKKERRNSPGYLTETLVVPHYEGIPEQRTVEPLISKNDMFKEFKEAQSSEEKDKKLEIDSEYMDEALNQLKKEYEGKIKPSHKQK